MRADAWATSSRCWRACDSGRRVRGVQEIPHADGGFVIGCSIFQVRSDDRSSFRRGREQHLLIRFPTMQGQLEELLIAARDEDERSDRRRQRCLRRRSLSARDQEEFDPDRLSASCWRTSQTMRRRRRPRRKREARARAGRTRPARSARINQRRVARDVCPIRRRGRRRVSRTSAALCCSRLRVKASARTSRSGSTSIPAPLAEVVVAARQPKSACRGCDRRGGAGSSSPEHPDRGRHSVPRR